MKVATLVHNPKAGDEDHTKKELVKLIEANGYSCRYSSTKKEGWKNFDIDVDLIAVAGGDGTVRKIVKELLKRKELKKAPPLAILPMGTANNISRALQVDGDIEKIVSVWQKAKPRQFDIGIVEGIPDTDFFLESIGFGLFPSFLNKVIKENLDDHESTDEELQAVLKELHEFVFTCSARRYEIKADGKDYSGEYLLAEAMNIKSIGPNLELAPKAKFDDGEFELVLLPEEGREQFSNYLLDKIKGKEQTLSLPVVKAKEFRISWDGTKTHVDDTLVTQTPFTEIKIKIRQGLLDFML
jgi:diacylglycerol kinase (ATP)